ncbi:hypothetical protein NXW84_00780 [Bacteroides fragilis]|nr:hypothetical protein NXW84_00780 [Bacteroides fragilis]
MTYTHENKHFFIARKLMPGSDGSAVPWSNMISLPDYYRQDSCQQIVYYIPKVNFTSAHSYLPKMRMQTIK